MISDYNDNRDAPSSTSGWKVETVMVLGSLVQTSSTFVPSILFVWRVMESTWINNIFRVTAKKVVTLNCLFLFYRSSLLLQTPFEQTFPPPWFPSQISSRFSVQISPNFSLTRAQANQNLLCRLPSIPGVLIKSDSAWWQLTTILIMMITLTEIMFITCVCTQFSMWGRSGGA